MGANQVMSSISDFREAQITICKLGKKISLTGFITNAKPRIRACGTKGTIHNNNSTHRRHGDDKATSRPL